MVSGAEVRTSHRELSALLTTSARGLGFNVGDAEDLARAAAWLSLRSYGGVAALLQTSPTHNELWLSEAGHATATGEVVVDGVSLGWHGPGLVDLLVSGAGSTVLRLRRVDSPLLLFALCAVAATDHRLHFTIISTGRGHEQRFEIDGFDCRPAPHGLPTDSAEFRISCRVANTDSRPWPTQEIVVSAEGWAAANRLAARTYVPGDERSRRDGAGAGLTDND